MLLASSDWWVLLGSALITLLSNIRSGWRCLQFHPNCDLMKWSNLNLKDHHKQYFVYSKVDFKVNTVYSSKCVLAGPVHMHIWIILCNTDQFYFLFLLLIKIYLCYFEIEPWEWYFLLTFARTYVHWKQGDANITAAATATSMRISTPLWVRVINWCIQG